MVPLGQVVKQSLDPGACALASARGSKTTDRGTPNLRDSSAQPAQAPSRRGSKTERSLLGTTSEESDGVMPAFWRAWRTWGKGMGVWFAQDGFEVKFFEGDIDHGGVAHDPVGLERGDVFLEPEQGWEGASLETARLTTSTRRPSAHFRLSSQRSRRRT